MGYTHYWTFKHADQPAIATERKYQRALAQCGKIVRAYSAVNGGLSGFTAHTAPGQYGGLLVNGKGQQQHEDFALREHFSDNFKRDGNEFRPTGFNFCKTARKPYDTVVVACLIVLQHYLGDAIQVSSDGDAPDWADGLQLAKRVTKIKGLQLPVGVHNAELDVHNG